MKKILTFLAICFAFSINPSFAVDLPDLPQNTTTTATEEVAVNPYELDMPYDKAIKQDKPVVLLFYTNWCGACKRALPLIKMQKTQFGQDFVFTTLNAEDTNYSDTIKDYRLRCFPTVYIIDPKYDNRVHLEVSYIFNADAFSKELKRYIKIRKLLDSAKVAE